MEIASDPFAEWKFPEEAWRQVWIQLDTWRNSREQMADLNFDPPSDASLDRALGVLQQWRIAACTPPKVTADGSGGLVLSWSNRELHIWDD